MDARATTEAATALSDALFLEPVSKRRQGKSEVAKLN